jgi:serine/threonine protein kinase
MNLVPSQLHGTRYSVVRPLGSGTMGEVFLVEHLDLGRRFVAKVLHAKYAEVPDYVARLRREGRALGQLRHPNIVAVTDFAETADGRPFIVMEYLEGCTLADELRDRGRLLRTEAITFARQTLSALGAAHGAGIVHRDIKPQNLFIQKRSGLAAVLKVLDFGAARDLQALASPAQHVSPTSTGTVVGTLGYLSPEGADGRRVDIRADIYAAGLVLTVMLAGHLPSRQWTRFNVLDLGLPKDAQDDLAPAILKALEPDPGQRFQDSIEFLAMLPEQ